MAEEEKVKRAVESLEHDLLSFYRFMLVKYSEKGIFQKQKMYFSVLVTKSEKNMERDAFYFHELASQNQFNFNFLAENSFFKGVFNLTLPSVKKNILFRISFKEDYINEERFLKMKANNFAISNSYFPTSIKAHILIPSDRLKKHEKENRLKIKLITNETIPVTEFMTVKSLISKPNGVIIFLTGGGFVSDMEKTSQYWLRK